MKFRYFFITECGIYRWPRFLESSCDFLNSCSFLYIRQVLLQIWMISLYIFELNFKIMDRSNVRQTHLRQSFVFNTNGGNSINRSFINTALVSDSLAYGDDLRKSRIQNLPNYRKTNLGDNIQFIVVFQTIQIERLSSQIQVLRMKIKQYERLLFNASNYQVQIRQLTEKCFSMERQRQQYRDQMEKLNKICQTLYHQNQMLKGRLNQMDFSLKQKFQSQKIKNGELMQEIQKWKSRYQASEKSKAKQLQDLRNLMECQRKSMIDRQIRQMTIRFQNERSTLQNQIRKCRQLLQNRNRQIEDYKQKMQRLQITVFQLKSYQNIISQHQNRIALLSQQLQRQNALLADKQQQIQNNKHRQYKLNQQIKEQTEWQNENKRLRAAMESKNKQLQEWKVRSSRLEDQVVRGKQMAHYNQQLKNKLNLASRQLDRLNGVLKGKMEEIQQWKKRLSDKEMQVSKYKNLENQIHNYQSKINNLKIQNDRVNGILKSRLSQIQDWKNRYTMIQTKITEYSYIDKEKKNLEDKFNNQIKLSEEMKFIISKMESDLNGYKKLQNQFKEVQRQNAALNKEIARLNNLLRNNSNQIEDNRQRFAKLQQSISQYRNIQMKVKDFQHKIIMLTQQIQRLNQLISQKNALITNLQKEQIQLHSKMNHYKSYQSRIQESQSVLKRSQDQINTLNRQIQNWQKKYKEADNKARDLDSQLFKNIQDKQKLSSILKSKNNQYDDLRNKFSRAEGDSRKASQLEATCQQLNSHIMGLVGDIQGYQRNLKSTQVQLQKQKQFTNEFAFKIIILSAQVERLSRDGGSSGVKSKQFLQLQENYSRLQSKVQSKNNQIQMLLTKITNLQSKIAQLGNQFNRLLQEAQKSQRQTIVLVKKIQEYQDYASRIHILGNQIDRLKAQNKNLDDDAKKMRLRYSDNIKSQKREQAIYIQIVMMAAQIQNLRGRISQRQISMDQMRKSILDPVRRV